MTQDSEHPTADPAGGADPLDETQPVEVPRFTPTPDPRPDTRWAWSTPASTTPASSSTAAWGAGSQPAGAGSPPNRTWTPQPTPAARRGSGAGIGTVVGVALLAAVLASSGTVLALNASGALAEPTPIAVASTTPAAPTTASTATGTTDESSEVISASAKVSPSVVKITLNGSSDPFGQTDQSGVGSGIIYNSNGWILTNHHVVTGAGSITVELKDGRSFAGTVYGIDTLTDLAIVKIDATSLPVASLGSSDGLKVGQLVIAVGSPLGTYSFSVTSGIVSGKGRSIVTTNGSTISNLIQTDAAINPGNSGGPLADGDGDVVGINTAMADGSNGIGFAIPIDIAKPIMAQAVKGEKLVRPWIGIRYEEIDPTVKQAEKLTLDNGALITSSGNPSAGAAVQAGSPAETAGLKEGDVITAINGMTVDQEHPLNLLLVQFAPKDTVQLTVVRNGQTLTVPLTLGVRPENLQ
jgi:S1-C subfamily serine protease